MIDNLRCVVLNADFSTLDIVSARKGIILCCKGKASVLEAHDTEGLRSENDIHLVPSQIVLKYLVKAKRVHNVPAHLNNRNLFVRDGYQCQYCGKHRSELASGVILTRDHIFPQERGGRDVWTNIVTACSRCNNRKANLLLHEAGMKLLKEPVVPTVFSIWQKAQHTKLKAKNLDNGVSAK